MGHTWSEWGGGGGSLTVKSMKFWCKSRLRETVRSTLELFLKAEFGNWNRGSVFLPYLKPFA